MQTRWLVDSLIPSAPAHVEQQGCQFTQGQGFLRVRGNVALKTHLRRNGRANFQKDLEEWGRGLWLFASHS
jgi:hypothetical protein